MRLEIPRPAIEVAGFRFAGVACGLKDDGQRDLAVIACDRAAVAAGAFTRNRLAAPPVEIARERMQGGRVQAIVVNTKSANAGTGAPGRRVALASCRLAAEILGAPEERVVPCSTGKIGLPLAWPKVSRGIREAVRTLSPGGFWDAAEAIRTTDAFAKGAVRQVATGRRAVNVAGMAKGAGMIAPDMATTLVFVMTDAAPDRPIVRRWLADGLATSFNAISVDGDTSTNDTALLMASGASGVRVRRGSAEERRLGRAVGEVLADLARMVVADGEGASKVVRVEVRGARAPRDAERAARAIACSTLVKTAFAGADPNWGRIACAAGYSGAALRAERLEIRIGGVLVARGGVSAGKSAELRARKAMGADEFTVEVNLGMGRHRASMLTCDLGEEYVRFNSDYSS